MIINSSRLILDDPTPPAPCGGGITVVSRNPPGKPPPAPKVTIPAAAGPTIAEMAVNFTGAVSRWVTAGMPVVAKEEFDRRLAICRGCEFWDENARMGLGKCNAPGCGCSKGKLMLATERCPIKKW